MALVKLLQRSLTCHTYFRQVLPLSFVQIPYQQTARYPPQQRNSYHHHDHHQQQNNDNNSARHHLPHWLFIATGTIATLGLSTYLKVTRSPENAAELPESGSLQKELFNIIKNDVILAYEMNGEQITADHGYPLRVIIPGVVGARQVKWLKKVLLSNEESLSHWQRRDYKGFNPSIDWHNVDFDKAESIQQYPVQSVICVPSDGSFIDEDETEIELEGYAWSGGGRGIIRVDVSVDGGKTWQDATIHPTEQSLYHTYAWTLWSATVPLPANHNVFLLFFFFLSLFFPFLSLSFSLLGQILVCVDTVYLHDQIQIYLQEFKCIRLKPNFCLIFKHIWEEKKISHSLPPNLFITFQ
ncbi:SUOX [Acanthosepion pharaonis]|uniref:SUOX n=1 Tax=Acanthosepion pharaonis TaxID=158019 RepID=A0A812E1Z7_ACAPH|nr:SUOX [Sepia pharaonis]